MSQSFWSGDNLYDQFFDPKLPHILPIYSFSLLSGSIGGHLTITLLFICATGVVINLSGKNMWGGVVYICLVLLSPGGATGHLAIFANFLIACSYYCLAKYRNLNFSILSNNRAVGWLISSAVLSGWAIGLRPNYGFALIPLSIWFVWQQKLHLQRVSIWMLCCFITIFAPIFAVLVKADIDFLSLIGLFRSWNSFFYKEVGINAALERILQMYRHPIGPFNLGLLISFIGLSVFIAAPRGALTRVTAFALALAFLWLSYFISHSYNHYVLMDLMLISLLISSIELKATSFLLCTIVGLLWVFLLFSPNSPHSSADSLIIENRRQILSWISSSDLMQVVSPTWLTPHWVQKNKVPTKGIHPEWSIGILDRYRFKDLEVVKKFALDVDWDTQCNNWEKNSFVFIGTKELYEKCKFDSFKEVSEFSKYPLRVWVKRE